MPASKRPRGRATGGRTTPKGTRPPGATGHRAGPGGGDQRPPSGSHQRPPGRDVAAPTPRFRSGHRG